MTTDYIPMTDEERERFPALASLERPTTSLRDVMAAAYRARLRLHCDIDDSYTDGVEDDWRHREYSIVPLGCDGGGEVGRLTFQVGDVWTHVGISARDGRSESWATDPTPREVLDTARAFGLISEEAAR